MAAWIVLFFKIISTIGTISSLLYYLASLWSAAQFHAEQLRAAHTTPEVGNLPPVSILKPLKGTDPQMEEALRSHCMQEYPEYEIVFGVNDPTDPALPLVEKIKAEFPGRSIRVVLCEHTLGANIKVSNLAQMMKHARHDHIVVNDADILVGPQYLRSVIPPLAEESTSLVTCLYRGVPAPTLGSRLEALGITTDFAAGVLTARYLENGIHFGLGSTLAFQRSSVAAIGGFESLVDYLADDYQLGHQITKSGKNIRLSEAIVQTALPAYSLREFWQHQMRWARTVRDSRFSGYVGLIFTFGLFWALLAVISLHGAPWTWALLAATLALRFAQAVVVGRNCLHDPRIISSLWLLPLRDLVAVVVWVASFFGHTVRWRGTLFYLKKGKLIRANGK